MRQECILVVHDDHLVREVVSLAFRDAYEVRQATTGVQAIGIVRRDRVSVVVLDYRLPDADGLQMLSEIRSARPDLPVIMVTGYGSEAVCAAAFKLGVRDYLPKPFTVFQLRRSVASALAHRDDGGERASVGRAHGLCGTPPRTDRPEIAIEKAVALIQQRYWDQLTLSGLAREVGVSKYRLSRRFHAVTGVTLRGYLLRARLEKAKVLLSTTRDHITEVALAVGYGDLPRFDKLFKRYTGVTPSVYRERGASATARERATAT
jgi:YesN/AraC family two-component response regulator